MRITLMGASAVMVNRATSFSIIKSDQLVIGGYASIEMVDKQNDLITLSALDDAVKGYMKDKKFRNVMTNHSNVQVGEVIPSYRDNNGRLWKTQVDDVGFFVVIKMREDIEKAREVARDIRSGDMRSFSIGGQALSKKTKTHKEFGEYNEIDKLDLHEVTICEKGINPEAKFDILKQDSGEMTNMDKALKELNSLLIKAGEEPKDSTDFNKSEENIENTIRESKKTDEIDSEGNEMSVKKEEEEGLELLDTEGEGEEVELMEGDNPNMPKMDNDIEAAEYKSELDPATGQVEAGKAGRMVDDPHDQLDGKYMAKYEDQSTLDVSATNLEKAYLQFKAEQLEELTFKTVKDKFQARFDNEMIAKQDEIAKSNYDAHAEVSELKKQFSNLLSSLKDEQATVIRKQEDAVAALNIPSPDTIAKMDWSEINQLVNNWENGA